MNTPKKDDDDIFFSPNEINSHNKVWNFFVGDKYDASKLSQDGLNDALIVATTRKNTSAAEILIKAGADHNLKNHKRLCAYDYAKDDNFPGIIQIFELRDREIRAENENSSLIAVSTNSSNNDKSVDAAGGSRMRI